MNLLKFSARDKSAFGVKNKKSESGQALIITALIFASIFAISVALGNWSVTQLRAVNDFSNSVISIAAADAGIECMLFHTFKSANGTPEPCPLTDPNSMQFNNGPIQFNLCNTLSGQGGNCPSSACSGDHMQSSATYGRSLRAFEICL